MDVKLYRKIEEKLFKDIEKEKGFSFKKLVKIIELEGLLKSEQA